MQEQLHELYEEIGRYYAAGDFSGLEAFLLRKYRESAPGCSCCYSSMTVTVLNELGTLYRGAGKQADAINSFSRAGKHVAAHLGTQNAEYATVINNLGGAYRLNSQYEEALDSFQKALSIYEEIGEKESYLYSSALNNMALVYIDTGDLENAERCLRDALASVKNLAAQSEEFIPEVAASYSNLAAVCSRRGDMETALSLCDKAFAEYEKVPEDSRDHLAAVWNLVGNIRVVQKDPAGAKEAYEKALSLTERFFGKNHEYEQLVRKLQDLN